jgi:hypothetical protein
MLFVNERFPVDRTLPTVRLADVKLPVILATPPTEMFPVNAEIPATVKLASSVAAPINRVVLFTVSP